MKFRSFFKKLLVANCLLFPNIVFASSGDNDLSIGLALAMEAFVSIHMSLFVFKPLSEIISVEKRKKIFWTLFAIRAIILIIFDLFVTTYIAMIDFYLVFIGAFTIIQISLVTKSKRSGTTNINGVQNLNRNNNGEELRCAKCNTILKITDKFCQSCGEPIDKNNVVASEENNLITNLLSKETVLSTNFDSIYRLPEDKMVEEIINRELIKAGVDTNHKLILADALKRKLIMNIMFSVLVFVYITLIFFHFPLYTYIIGIIILFVFYKAANNYKLVKHLKKKIKERPGEKISNIIMNAKNTFEVDYTKKVFFASLAISIVLPIIIFSTPKIIYEKTNGGYAVRYYIFGLTNFKSATIPETHNNEPVVSLRGNTFSNMPFLESLNLPDTVIEIRGQAFKNCYNLKNVNIPKNLEYLGGGAFYNAKSIKNIELPDTLNFLGGESFYGATSLESIKLSNALTEIRGNTFENCISLKKIAIPDNVTRIGGHAFFGAENLYEVQITSNSKLNEIGSSAFRECYSLTSITIPRKTFVNGRAFKESPTNIKYFYENNIYYDN